MIRDIRPVRMELIPTEKSSKKLACAVRKATGATVTINCMLYDTHAWKPCCWCRCNGVTLSTDRYTTYWGLAWNNADAEFTVVRCVDMEKWDNYICGNMLVKDGKAQTIYCDAAVGRSSGRTAIIGLADGTVLLWCVKEGEANQTPWELQTSILAIPGAVWALMLDGGDSSQLSQDGNEYVYSARAVQMYLCLWDAEDAASTPQDRVIALARKEIGVKESPPGSNTVKYNTAYYRKAVSGAAYPWCCVFQWWVFRQAGIDLPVKTASCTALKNAYAKLGRVTRWGIKPGDLVFFDWSGKKRLCQHVGIVEKVVDGWVYTIEGNTGITSDDNGGCVMPRKRDPKYISFVAHPNYE